MKEINGLKIYENELKPLYDEVRKRDALTYFYGTVAELAVAKTRPEIYEIWQHARRHLEGVYLVSDYRKEDFHVLDMSLARAVRQRGDQLNGPLPVKPKLPALTPEEQLEVESLYDRAKIKPVRRVLRLTIKEFRMACTEQEIEAVYQNSSNRLVEVYCESEHKERDLTVCLLLLAHRYKLAVINFLKKRSVAKSSEG